MRDARSDDRTSGPRRPRPEQPVRAKQQLERGALVDRPAGVLACEGVDKPADDGRPEGEERAEAAEGQSFRVDVVSREELD